MRGLRSARRSVEFCWLSQEGLHPESLPSSPVLPRAMPSIFDHTLLVLDKNSRSFERTLYGRLNIVDKYRLDFDRREGTCVDIESTCLTESYFEESRMLDRSCIVEPVRGLRLWFSPV
eukprot:TRINITY_DN2055_c0_g5_i1.p1 TRINITY_DN2055_c0_g5~~TRINITY_DN2055_c0_g5_i1.p1  ORF type:complete len:118 (+),score=4.86 TRINITY_DN2055_c0_g5_i1:115-468(+)